MFDIRITDGVLRATRPATDWLATTWNGGYVTADAAYNVTVPEGWERTDLDAYLDERLTRAGFDTPGPALFTGVDQAHARGARAGGSVAIATCGLSNPTTLPMDPAGWDDTGGNGEDSPGTVNLIVGTDRSLDAGGLATLLTVVAESRTATLLSATGFTGTTTDAVVVGCDPTGDSAPFAGSGTPVGADTRACVREAVRASLRSRYPDGAYAASVDAAEHGSVTGRRATVFIPDAEDTKT